MRYCENVTKVGPPANPNSAEGVIDSPPWRRTYGTFNFQFQLLKLEVIAHRDLWHPLLRVDA